MSRMVMLCALFAMFPSPLQAQPEPVTLSKEDGRWALRKGGKPYFIKGAAGDHSLRELKEAGGNSTRTWDAKGIDSMLDEAQRLGMTVTVGFWLGHKEHGFNYNDPKQVKEQYERVRSDLLKYRGHPAVLMWALGNEMEINNDVPEVWRAIGDLAKLVKSLDKSRPVMTITADTTPSKVRHLKELAPDVDILGINTYGGALSISQRLKEAGWDKPYIITEFGPRGPWEVAKTSWGAPREDSSTEKAKLYDQVYRQSVLSQPGWCLGSYAFTWGHKQETTPTWFGMVLPSGEQLGSVDVLSRHWTGKEPKNRAPEVLGFALNVDSDVPLEPGQALSPHVSARDLDGDPLTYRWEVRREVAVAKYAGDGEVRPEIVPVRMEPVGNTNSSIKAKAPVMPGAYRFYVFVFDRKGKAATANIPFKVKEVGK